MKRVGFAPVPHYSTVKVPKPTAIPHYSVAPTNKSQRYLRDLQDKRAIYSATNQTSPLDTLGTGLGVASAIASIPAVYNPYVAGTIAAAGAAIGAYQLGKTIYKAIF